MNSTPCLIILFGLPGIGKTQAGDLLAREAGFDFIDADDLLSTELRQRLADAHNEEDVEIARDVWFEQIVVALAQRLAMGGRVAFAQALVQQKHRDLLRSHFPFARFILIKADSSIVDDRLAGRKHFLPAERAAALRDLFEPVENTHTVIDNDGDLATLRQQLMAYLDKL